MRKIFFTTILLCVALEGAYATDYNIYYDMNGGDWKSGWIGTRTEGAGDVVLSSDVTKTDYNFGGWYDNGSFDGEPITSIASDYAADITLYAKWTEFSKTTLTPALYPIVCTASEGDVVVVTVSAKQSDGAYIQLEDKDGVAFGNSLSISGVGTYAIPLTSADAAKVNAGLNVSGSNYTIGDVTINYRKVLWNTGIDGTEKWASATLEQAIFSDLTTGDFLGAEVSKTNGGSYFSYSIQINYVTLFEQAVSGEGTFTRPLTSSELNSLQTTDKTISIGSANIAVDALNTYVADKHYTVTLNANDGTINADNVTSYTFGTGATLPTDVTRDGYNFDGWYDNAELTGSAVTTITTSDYGNKTYWAKWTSLEQTKTPANYSRLSAAEEGDILVVNVTAIGAGSSIKINKSADGSNLFTKDIAATGKYAFQLSASDATALHTGMILSGTNYTGTVELLLKKTIWDEGLESNTNWKATDNLGHTGLEDIAEGDYLGFTVSALGDGADYHQYAMQYDWGNVISSGVSATGTYLEEIDGTLATNLAEGSGAVSMAATYLTLSELNRYLSTRDYTVTLNTNSGTINAGNVTTYTFGVGATLPTDVNKWGYKFDGWYDNSSFTGSAVTTITTSDYGNKEYWAKWTSIEETMLSGSHPEFLAAEEGDILVITVTNTQPRAQIYMQSTDYALCVGSKWIAGTGAGKHAFQLTAAGATALHTGVIISGENYTKSSVALLYKNDIWTGSLESPIENVVWQSQSIASSKFAGIEDGDYVSFTISSIAEDSSWCQYNLYSGTGGVLTYSAKSSGSGTYIHEIPSGKATELQADGDYIIAQNLTISAFSRYLTTRDYTVTLNTNGGTINADNVTSYTYPIGATLPTNVTRDGYNFDGWYAYEELTGDPVTEITISDYGNKTYWAKWTPIAQNVSSETDKSLKIASEGDLLVINVATIGESAQIVVKNYTGDANLFTKEISATGKYAFPLSSTDATALRTGLTITGTNYTYTYQLLYRKTIWHDVLESPKDEVEWQTASLTHADMAGIADGDYVGFTVSAINTGGFHQYNLCAYEDPTTYTAANNTTNDAGTYIETIKSGFATHLLDENKSVFIAAQNLTLTDFYRYLPTRDYTLTLDDQFASTAFYVAGEGSRTVTYQANTNLTSTFTKPQREGYTFGGYYTAVDGGGTQIIDANGDVVAGASDASYTYTDASRKWNYPGSLTIYAKWTDDGNYYFYGGESRTGTAWATGANWTKGAAPSASTHDVTLLKPATLSTGTTKLASVTIVPGDGDSYTPTGGSAITPSGALTIPPTGALVANTISGATENTLLIESSASGTGALVTASESHTTAATVQFYTKAKNDVGGSGYINQYFGTPVDSVVKNPTFYGAYLRKFDVATDAWASFSDSKMYGFTAYRIMRAETSEGTYSVQGNLILPGTTTHKDTVLRLTNTAKKDNMFANSWTAPINIAKLDAEDFVGAVATVYVFNAGSASDGTNTEAFSGAGAGNWSATPVEALKSAIAADPDQTTYEMTQIPSQQAFLVQTDGDGGTYTLTLDYKKLVYDPVSTNGATITPTRAPKRTLDAEVDLMQLNLSAESGLRDRVLLYVSDDFSTDELDNGWEAYKLSGEAFAPQLCANTPLGEMAISATKDIEGTVLGFYAGSQDDHYTFTFDYNGEDTWYLNDLDEKQSTVIDSENEYAFTASKGTVAAKRFTISKSPIHNIPTGNDDVNDGVKARKLMMNGTLYIIRDGRIYDAQGALVK